MTRKHVEAVIEDCVDCPSFNRDGIEACNRTAPRRVMDPEWYDTAKGYIPSWCPLADAPCETCNNLRTVPDGSGHKICPAFYAHRHDRDNRAIHGG